MRGEVVRLLELAAAGRSWSELLGAVERLWKTETDRFENVLELFYSALTDLLEFSCGFKGRIPRNPDLQGRLERLGRSLSPEQVRKMMESLDRLSAGLRRNINRQLSLDAAVLSWADIGPHGLTGDAGGHRGDRR